MIPRIMLLTGIAIAIAGLCIPFFLLGIILVAIF